MLRSMKQVIIQKKVYLLASFRMERKIFRSFLNAPRAYKILLLLSGYILAKPQLPKCPTSLIMRCTARGLTRQTAVLTERFICCRTRFADNSANMRKSGSLNTTGTGSLGRSNWNSMFEFLSISSYLTCLTSWQSLQC